MYPQTELLFPPNIIPEMTTLRSAGWRKLVSYVAALPETHPDVLAFMLMITRLTDCLACQKESFRAWRGCRVCSLQAVARFKGSDVDLIGFYQQAQAEVAQYIAEGQIAHAA
jgi:hypothetical protein